MTTLTSFRLLLRSAIAATLLACVTFAPAKTLRAQDVSSLALPERRAIKEYQDTKLPDLQKQINVAAKFDVPLEVQWAALAAQGDGESFQLPDFFTNVYFVPLADALKQITGDAMGAESLKTKLKKVVVTYDEATGPAGDYEKRVKFEGGTLTLNFRPFTNAQDATGRTKAIVAALSSKL